MAVRYNFVASVYQRLCKLLGTVSIEVQSNQCDVCTTSERVYEMNTFGGQGY